MFEGEWDQRSLFGWESSIAKIYGEEQSQAMATSGQEEQEAQASGDVKQDKSDQSNYCEACRKGFSNPTVYEFHLKGKRHIKAEALLKT